MTAPAESAAQAFLTSAFSLKALAAAVEPLMRAAAASSASTSTPRSRGRSTTGWAWPRRRSSPSRAIWRATSARAGSASTSSRPVRWARSPLAGSPGFEQLAELWQAQAPLGWDPEDPGPVASAICFLLSDYARAISGEILHVDGGFHALGRHLVSSEQVFVLRAQERRVRPGPSSSVT